MAVSDSLVAFLKTNYMMIGIAVVVLLLILVSVFVAKKYLDKKKKTVEDEEDDYGEKTCEILFFHTHWCPYCKKAMPEWKAFSNQWNGKIKNGYIIITTEIDCEQNEAVANKFEVISYPTIKCSMNGKTTDFDAKPTAAALNQFLDSCFQ